MVSLNITSNKLLKFYHLSVKDKLKFVVYSLMFNFFLFIFRLLGYKKSKKIINSIVNPSKNTEDIKEKNVENESIIIGYSTNNTLFSTIALAARESRAVSSTRSFTIKGCCWVIYIATDWLRRCITSCP